VAGLELVAPDEEDFAVPNTTEPEWVRAVGLVGVRAEMYISLVPERLHYYTSIGDDDHTRWLEEIVLERRVLLPPARA
jgi:hypothetical protein